MRLETLDLREVPHAIAGFERAIAIDPRYGSAYTGLASAELAAYEATRGDTTPAGEVLDRAIMHARRAVALDDTHAEAHATLALVLVSAWQTDEALTVARRAVAIDPGNWRHHFRLGHAAWGAERLAAAERTLAVYPEFAFTHFQTAMVHVARCHLTQAETVLRQGAAVQDRQTSRGDRYPALGLHWLLAMVRLAQGDADEALREFERERLYAEPHRIYGREYQIGATHGRGLALLALGQREHARAAFHEALAMAPDHAQSRLGLLAAEDPGADSRESLTRIAAQLDTTRPIEAALVRAQLSALDGHPAQACDILCRMLDQAPPGFAGWTVPVEPHLRQMADSKALDRVRRQLAKRAD